MYVFEKMLIYRDKWFLKLKCVRNRAPKSRVFIYVCVCVFSYIYINLLTQNTGAGPAVLGKVPTVMPRPEVGK